MVLGTRNWNLLAAIVGELQRQQITEKDVGKFLARSSGIRETYHKKMCQSLEANGFPENTGKETLQGLLY